VERLNLAFFDLEYYNSFEETGHVELVGDSNRGVRPDGENEFTQPDRLPPGWFQFPKEKLIHLFLACPSTVHKKLHGHPDLWKDPQNYTALESDPQV
jgi:hypothetical protein